MCAKLVFVRFQWHT